MSKEYGLIIPGKNKPGLNVVKKPAIFQQDSDSDDSPPRRPTGVSKLKPEDRAISRKAIEEDPTVYQYDEIYDEMDQKRQESKLSRKDLDRKPKYINRLLVAADRRKRENERRIERQVQKEREAEGEEFKDKESFVTSAYKKKLEELREMEEQEKREEYLEAIGDVRRQGNLDGFYRHLYDQKVNKCEEKSADIVEKEATVPVEAKAKEDDNKVVEDKKESKKRHYRKRQDSKSQSDSDKEDAEKSLAHLPSNLDADSDFSIDSDSDEDQPKSKQAKSSTPPPEPTDKETKNDNNVEKDATQTEKVDVKVEKKLKVDIWKKRTVGPVFDEALQRFFERKALRESG